IHSDPQISPQEIALPCSSSGGARTHRCCRVKAFGGSASTTLSPGPLGASTFVGSPSTRCCTEQFIREKISDKMQRRSLALTIHQELDRYLISIQIIVIE